MHAVEASRRAALILGGIALAAAIQAAQPPDAEEERTPFGQGAKHPLKALLPRSHPLAQNRLDMRMFKPEEPLKYRIPVPEKPDMDVEIEYDAATKKERRGMSAIKRPQILRLPKTAVGLNNMIRIEKERPQQRTIFMGESRQPVNFVLSYPHRAVCKLFVSWPNGMSTEASGIIVGPRHALTAGHCIYRKERGGWATKVEVIPGYDGIYNPAYKPYGSAFMSKMQSFNGWTYYGSFDHDAAILLLDRRIGSTTGWVGYWHFAANVGRWGHTAGYPGSLGPNPSYGRQYYDGDKIRSETAYINRFLADVNKGQSGSGIWRWENGYPYVFSIVSYEAGDHNGGCRVNQQKLNSFSSFIAAYP